LVLSTDARHDAADAETIIGFAAVPTQFIAGGCAELGSRSAKSLKLSVTP
jgi:hypothetical protein